MNNVYMRVEIEKIEIKDSKFIIVGNMSGTFRSISEKGKPRKEVAEIKDGKFEIILSKG